MGDAESEVASLNRKITLLEEDLDRSEERFSLANAKLSSTNQAAEESERLVNSLKMKMDQDDGKLAQLEDQVAGAKARAEERAEVSESKIVELEEEVRVVSNNLKSLEASEVQSSKAEESYADQVRELDLKSKEAEVRAET